MKENPCDNCKYSRGCITPEICCKWRKWKDSCALDMGFSCDDCLAAQFKEHR